MAHPMLDLGNYANQAAARAELEARLAAAGIEPATRYEVIAGDVRPAVRKLPRVAAFFVRIGRRLRG